MAVSPDESVVAVSAQEVVRQPKKIVLYNVEGDALVPFKEIVGHQKAVFALAFSPDGKVPASICLGLMRWLVCSLIQHMTQRSHLTTLI